MDLPGSTLPGSRRMSLVKVLPRNSLSTKQQKEIVKHAMVIRVQQADLKTETPTGTLKKGAVSSKHRSKSTSTPRTRQFLNDMQFDEMKHDTEVTQASETKNYHQKK
eukprot:CAMPEP_0114503212 /NCGR_PEP_ID=MMETSP0109-20121206/9522_1 /TAXON_ID=29199 /ORGANISM="Chlorarachnion reptans, Strain CCCM449" /LENGTH=106 /DNA_ID=CAMNT_0001681215 /DNA_START=884 /DNA_END=1204 /DNA_ORIENTATION=+